MWIKIEAEQFGADKEHCCHCSECMHDYGNTKIKIGEKYALIFDHDNIRRVQDFKDFAVPVSMSCLIKILKGKRGLFCPK
jgi:hypothetical protein